VMGASRKNRIEPGILQMTRMRGLNRGE
jgi:hypothetical protein